VDWERRREVLRPGLLRLRPDVVVLQERARGPGDDQAADLLGPDYRIVWHSARSAGGVGAALASRWPFGKVSEIDLHVTPRVDLPWAAAVRATLPPRAATALEVRGDQPG
jgi:hypothetical protein